MRTQAPAAGGGGVERSVAANDMDFEAASSSASVIAHARSVRWKVMDRSPFSPFFEFACAAIYWISRQYRPEFSMLMSSASKLIISVSLFSM